MNPSMLRCFWVLREPPGSEQRDLACPFQANLKPIRDKHGSAQFPPISTNFNRVLCPNPRCFSKFQPCSLPPFFWGISPAPKRNWGILPGPHPTHLTPPTPPPAPSPQPTPAGGGGRAPRARLRRVAPGGLRGPAPHGPRHAAGALGGQGRGAGRSWRRSGAEVVGDGLAAFWCQEMRKKLGPPAIGALLYPSFLVGRVILLK